MKNIKKLAEQFRKAMDIAKDLGDFNNNSTLCRFPCGCCTVASGLLAQFLLENDIRTYEFYGTYRDENEIQSHEWLLTKDDIIIDITGDQFKYNPIFLNYDATVYVGIMDDFHRLFKIEQDNFYENMGLASFNVTVRQSLSMLYNKIISYV